MFGEQSFVRSNHMLASFEGGFNGNLGRTF